MATGTYVITPTDVYNLARSAAVDRLIIETVAALVERAERDGTSVDTAKLRRALDADQARRSLGL